MTDRVLPDPFQRGAFLVRTGQTSQSWVHPDEPLRLEFEYVQRIAEVLELTVLTRALDQRIRVIHLGGGGLTLPRWIAAVRPHTAQIVCEPDAELMAQVRRRIPLERSSGIKVRETDGRSGLAQMPDDYADVIIVDAFDGLHVPAELATSEFFADALRVSKPGAVLVMNLADETPFGWAKPCIAGITSSFRNAFVTAEAAIFKGRRYGNLVVAASNVPLPLASLDRGAARSPFNYRTLHGTPLRRWLAGSEPWADDTAEPSPGPAGGRTWFS